MNNESIENNSHPMPLTLASRQAFARDTGLDPESWVILEKHVHLEEVLASLLDAGLAQSAFKIIARMLDPTKSMLWVVLAQDLVEGEARPVARESARRALLKFINEASPDTAWAAEKACQILGGTDPFAIAVSGLALSNDKRLRPDQAQGDYPSGLFSELVASAILLINLSLPGDEREKKLIAKKIASRGVTLALSANQ